MALLALSGFFLAAQPPACAAEERVISIEEFEDSAFAGYFRTGEYEPALKAVEDLLRTYPDDPLLLRYWAMTLDHLGNSEEAIRQFQELLLRDPNHVPTRYFLGLAYERAGLIEEAAEQWLGVIERSPVATYWQWAAVALDRVYDRTAGLGLEEPGMPLPPAEIVPSPAPSARHRLVLVPAGSWPALWVSSGTPT